MKNLKFIKMHGLGNDFVIIDSRNKAVKLSSYDIEKISDRRFGVGCDQFVTLNNSENYDCKIEFYNSDGSKAGACGNASRCVAWLMIQEKQKNNTLIETADRVLKCDLVSENIISIEMGEYSISNKNIPLNNDVDPLQLPEIKNSNDGVGVGVGNPHAIYFVNKLSEIDGLEKYVIDQINSIYPKQANISLVEIVSKNEINQRVWERGSGETLACGTGACAAVSASNLRGYTDNEVKVNLKGGSLKIIINDKKITMIGEVTKVFEGVFC